MPVNLHSRSFLAPPPVPPPPGRGAWLPPVLTKNTDRLFRRDWFGKLSTSKCGIKYKFCPELKGIKGWVAVGMGSEAVSGRAVRIYLKKVCH